MHCWKFITTLVLSFIVLGNSLMGGAIDRFLLHPNDDDSDALVRTMLIDSGIQTPLKFWRETVAQQIAEAQGTANETTLLGLVMIIKDNLLSGDIEVDNLGNVVEHELDSLITGYLVETSEAHPEPVAQVIPAQPNIIAKGTRHCLHRKLTRMDRSISRNYNPAAWRATFAPKVFLELDECSICTQTDIAVYYNICPCNQDIALCESCITNLTAEAIVGKLILAEIGEKGPIHIDFSLKLPSCPYCRKLYSGKKRLARLNRQLPIAKRKQIVIQAIENELARIPQDKLPEFLGRLIASNVPYTDIATHNKLGLIIPLRFIATQIFTRTQAMREGITEQFSNRTVWLR